MIALVHDEPRWQRARDALRLVCPHARATRFIAAHLGRNSIHQHRLFLVPGDAAVGSRVIDERARREWPLVPGSATLLPARRTYRFDFEAGFHLVGFHFRLEGPGGVDVLDGVLETAQHLDALADATAAVAALALSTPGAWLQVEGLLRAQLGRTMNVSWAAIEQQAAVGRRWKATLARLESATPGAAEVTRLAQAAGISRQHFTRTFRADFGCTPRDWQQRQLARRVVDRLLADDSALAEVAEEFGFSDAFALSRFVLRATGQRPSAWRGTLA
jgi:AraC-like DNA-binding protein